MKTQPRDERPIEDVLFELAAEVPQASWDESRSNPMSHDIEVNPSPNVEGGFLITLPDAFKVDLASLVAMSANINRGRGVNHVENLDTANDWLATSKRRTEATKPADPDTHCWVCGAAPTNLFRDVDGDWWCITCLTKETKDKASPGSTEAVAESGGAGEGDSPHSSKPTGDSARRRGEEFRRDHPREST